MNFCILCIIKFPLMNRIRSIDVLRGLTVGLMIVVNNPGSWATVYPPLLHAKWHGCTPTDLVFPFFIFIVGMSLYFSFKNTGFGLSQPNTVRILKRGGKIVLVGMLLHAFPFYTIDFDSFRFLGVLQRIGLVFIVGSLFCLALKRYLLLGTAVLLLLYWWGFEAFSNAPYTLETSLSTWLDRSLLGAKHLYLGFGAAFDPEGLYGTLGAVGNLTLGFYTSKLLDSYKQQPNRLLQKLFVLGGVLILLGWTWGQLMPINKPLWTSSYVVFSSGICVWILSVCVYLIDLKGIQKWSNPFVQLGTNPLAVYVLAGIVAKLLWLIKFTPSGTSLQAILYGGLKALPISAEFSSLLFALLFTASMWVVAYILYKKKIFIKL